ncbi:(2Fe-2S) ferredoxin domain-containing protein [Lichenibacterium ramalinae]|uniref:(2Fe-2S) ferredoxin domain-containing protein n=1 Tax=Lichenibacterium ramalinae TaxID=2316527 RepID=A0A4Q2RAA3_9HYPH|nr:(2Fe-2S) ferredoxin domain-containing protein [Lichenibacterium ramalinae]RYB02522.1 (2Fe-2S) ferredoxin domain-containing protein [Lichenibacterium ramalinae]
MGRDGTWKQVEAEWRDVVLVCRKCARKLDGGFGPDGEESLAKALRRSFDADPGRKLKARRRAIAVLEVGCLDICPKKAVVVVKGSEPGAMILVPKGAGIPDVVERLGLGPGSA